MGGIAWRHYKYVGPGYDHEVRHRPVLECRGRAGRSCKHWGLWKRALRFVKDVAYPKDGEPLCSPGTDFEAALAVVAVCIFAPAKVETVLAITLLPEPFVRRVVNNLRAAKVIHGDRLSIGEWLEKRVGWAALMLDALSAEGSLEGGMLCPRCRGWCNRAGYSPSQKQRWRCRDCGRSTVYPATTALGRMRVEPEKIKRALTLFRRGWTPAAVAKNVGLSLQSARKIADHQNDIAKIREEEPPPPAYTTAGSAPYPPAFRERDSTEEPAP
jgi:transposase-like protein